MAQVRLETARSLAYLDLLGNLGPVLEEAAVEWVVLKGPVLAEVSYRGALRGYTDLDLLVPARQFKTAVRALGEAGAVPTERDWPLLLSNAKGEVSLSVADSPLVDLHWHLVYLRSARERFRIPTDALLERRQRIQLRGVDAWILEPTDFAIHVALHASFAGVERLRRLLDIERTVACRAPDWDLFVRRCRAWRVALPVSVMLESARRVLGAPVPADVLRKLTGGRLDRFAVRQLSAWVPSGPLPGGRSVRTGLTRCLRDGWLATSAEFAREVWRTAAIDFRTALDRSADPRHPADAGGFERYVAMVNRTDHYGHLAYEEPRRFTF
jgi:hypothetical protein